MLLGLEILLFIEQGVLAIIFFNLFTHYRAAQIAKEGALSTFIQRTQKGPFLSYINRIFTVFSIKRTIIPKIGCYLTKPYWRRQIRNYLNRNQCIMHIMVNVPKVLFNSPFSCYK